MKYTWNVKYYSWNFINYASDSVIIHRIRLIILGKIQSLILLQVFFFDEYQLDYGDEPYS